MRTTTEVERKKKMPAEQFGRSFSQMVTKQLTPEIRELWTLMADNYNRDGPEAVKIYLDAEKDRLEGNVRSLLEQFKEG